MRWLIVVGSLVVAVAVPSADASFPGRVACSDTGAGKGADTAPDWQAIP